MDYAGIRGFSEGKPVILRSIETTSLPGIIAYARALESFQVSIGIPPTNPLIRFNIGQYQLAGCIGWKNTDCEWESYASAFIHFVACMESLDLHVEKFVPRDLTEPLRMVPDWKAITFRVSRAVQMLMYCQQRGKTERSKRFNPGQLEDDIGRLCMMCMHSIPTNLRAKAIFDATEILSKRV